MLERNQIQVKFLQVTVQSNSHEHDFFIDSTIFCHLLL